MLTENKIPAPMGCGRMLLLALVIGSFVCNLIFCVSLGIFMSVPADDDKLTETIYRATDHRSTAKIAVVKVSGLLMEGMIDYATKQIEQVSGDEGVRAVVLRIDSPGGTISASEVLHRAITQMGNGKHNFADKTPKKIVVSMGALAASGGYYIAMPGEYIYAENYCLTGSIGVYASLPNVAELGKKYGVKMELIKAGDIKASGSPFHELTPAERNPWQEMVDNAYDQFLDVVSAGRPKLPKPKWTERILQKEVAERNDKGEVVKDEQGKPKMVKVERYRADGGTYTAKQAIEFGLIDEVGTLDDAITKAASLANITSYKVVKYNKPTNFLGELIGIKAKPPGLELDQISNALVPRGWMLMPGADLAVLGLAK